MIGEGFEKGGDSSRRMHIQSTSDTPPKWDIRYSYIPLNWNDMRSIVDIPKLYEMLGPKYDFCEVT
jgi:hypothetical protein